MRLISGLMFQAIHVNNNMSDAARQAQEEAEIKVSMGKFGLKWQVVSYLVKEWALNTGKLPLGGLARNSMVK